ncbi:MAG: hypothetical protein ABJD11_01700 [Gemmatimonadota bacterium]
MLQLPTPPPLESFPSPPFWMVLPPGIALVMVIAVVVGMTTLLLPLARAFARRLDGRGHEDATLRADLEQMRGRLTEVDSLQLRLAEMEERLDFTERMLAQQRDVQRLKGS